MSQQSPKKGSSYREKPSDRPKQKALVLQGGGGLGAYEVGAVKAIVEHIIKENNGQDKHVFDIIAGSSIGAINGSLLIGQFLKSNSWMDASQKLEDYWNTHIASNNSWVDYTSAFTDWWDIMSKTCGSAIASTEAARRYYSSLQFWLRGVPELFLSSTKYDNRFLNWQFNFLQRGDWSPFGKMLEDAKVLPIKTSPREGQPRLLTTAIDVQTGGGAIFDSYSKSTTYGKEGEEIVINHPDGLTVEHVMASAAIPANLNYAIIKDRRSTERMFWDGAFASNTPLRGLMQSHRDFWLKTMHQMVPDLEEVYVITLWPRKMDKIPIPPDNNFVWSRTWDLLFEDKTTYVEKSSNMVTDYMDIIEKLQKLAEEHGFKKEADEILTEMAKSKNRAGVRRTKREVVDGRFKIGAIHNIGISAFEDASALKIFDFSKKTISQLINEGYDDAKYYFERRSKLQPELEKSAST